MSFDQSNDFDAGADRSDELRFDDILEAVNQAAEVRAEKRREFAEKTPDPEMCLVAWIDILGFKEELRAATSPAEFKVVYDKVRMVHEEFSKESASDDPEFQRETNRTYGRRVISLSDGLVVVQSLKAEARSVFDDYGFIVGYLEDLRLAQARCAHKGVFLRGGIDFGSFWFEDDILLSPALVEAYAIETKVAKNPAILLPVKIAKQITKLDGRPAGATKLEFLRECEWLEEPERGKFQMLDYMEIIVNDDHGWHSEEDRLAYLDRSKPGPELDRIFNESRDRQTGRILRSLKTKLIDAYGKAPNEGVRNKYRWLMRYFNGSFPHDHVALAGAAIDASDGVSLVDFAVGCHSR